MTTTWSSKLGAVVPSVVCPIPRQSHTPADAEKMYLKVRKELHGLGADAYKREAARRMGLTYEDYDRLRKEFHAGKKAAKKAAPPPTVVKKATEAIQDTTAVVERTTGLTAEQQAYRDLREAVGKATVFEDKMAILNKELERKLGPHKDRLHLGEYERHVNVLKDALADWKYKGYEDPWLTSLEKSLARLDDIPNMSLQEGLKVGKEVEDALSGAEKSLRQTRHQVMINEDIGFSNAKYQDIGMAISRLTGVSSSWSTSLVKITNDRNGVLKTLHDAFGVRAAGKGTVRRFLDEYGSKGFTGKRTQEAIDWYEKWFSLDMLAERRGTSMFFRLGRVVSDHGDSAKRAWYQPWDQTVAIGKGTSARTIVHEMGHHWENQMYGWQRTALQWRRYRAGDERLTNIYEPKPGHAAEVGYKDKFYTHYVGRDYGDTQTECISMGLEMMYHDPDAFYKKDPDHFAMIWGLMTGVL